MSFEDLEGGQEASHHKGESYRQRVEAYLESGEYLSVGDGHSGTSDIVCIRPATESDKEFRVETKDTKLSRFDQGFIDELARQFIDYHATEQDFEFLVFAPYYRSESDWKDIFRDRTRKEDAVREYFEEIEERQGLNPDEAEELDKLDFEDFRRFLEGVAIKRAGYERLAQLIDEREAEDSTKWDFYTRENQPVREAGELTPNFVKIAEYPDTIYTLPSEVSDYSVVYDLNPRYLPIWLEGEWMYSLIPPAEMEESLSEFVDTEATESDDFREWMDGTGDEDRDRLATILLNRQLTWRGVKNYDRCIAVRHDGVQKLIFEPAETRPASESTTVQRDLSGNEFEVDTDKDTRDDAVEGWDVTKDWGSCVAHRYGRPQVKTYDGDHYVFVSTGWLFTEMGRGNVIGGERADKLHRELEKGSNMRHNNVRAMWRQWHAYLGLGRKPNQQIGGRGATKSQELAFKPVTGLELRERPPKTAEERERLMSQGRVE